MTKTKALISFAVTAKLICAFVFAYAKAGFLTTRLILFFYCRFSLVQKCGVPCTALAYNLRRKTEYLAALSDYSLKCFDTGKMVTVKIPEFSDTSDLTVDILKFKLSGYTMVSYLQINHMD